MPRTFFDLNLLANMVAKLDNIVGEHVKFDMFANNVGQFGHTFMCHFSNVGHINEWNSIYMLMMYLCVKS